LANRLQASSMRRLNIQSATALATITTPPNSTDNGVAPISRASASQLVGHRTTRIFRHQIAGAVIIIPWTTSSEVGRAQPARLCFWINSKAWRKRRAGLADATTSALSSLPNMRALAPSLVVRFCRPRVGSFRKKQLFQWVI
jgi:hypothetical protein